MSSASTRASARAPGACRVMPVPSPRLATPLVGTSGSSFAASRLASQQHRPGSRQIGCRGLFGLGLPEIAVIAGVAALIFGPSKLPELGRGLGKTLKSFQSAAKEFESELKTAAAEDPVDAKQPEQPAKKE